MKTVMRVAGCVLGMSLVLGCASDKAAKEEAPARRAANTTQEGLAGAPDPGVPADGWVSLDERGAFGPIVVAHLDVMPDGNARCFRRHAKTGDVSHTIAFPESDVAQLKEAMAAASTLTAAPAARTGTVQDVGTTTLSVRDQAKVVTLTVDSRNTVEPPQAPVLGLLSGWLMRCVEAP